MKNYRLLDRDHLMDRKTRFRVKIYLDSIKRKSYNSRRLSAVRKSSHEKGNSRGAEEEIKKGRPTGCANEIFSSFFFSRVRPTRGLIWRRSLSRNRRFAGDKKNNGRTNEDKKGNWKDREDFWRRGPTFFFCFGRFRLLVERRIIRAGSDGDVGEP